MDGMGKSASMNILKLLADIFSPWSGRSGWQQLSDAVSSTFREAD